MNPKQSISIAIADDHTLFRKGIAALLASYTHISIMMEAENGQALLQQIAASPTLPDICILDINMPVMDGYTTLQHLKQQWPHIRVLALTMFGKEHSILRFVRAGAHGYLLKDTDPDEFVRAIELAHKDEYYYPDAILRKLYLSAGDPAKNRQLMLSTDEQRFLSYCCTELTYKEIAGKMAIDTRTVESHRDSLFKKLEVRTRIGLAMYAANSGIAIYES